MPDALHSVATWTTEPISLLRTRTVMASEARHWRR